MRFILLILIAFAGCSERQQQLADMVEIAVPSDIMTLDPHATVDVGSSRIIAQVYNRLVEKNMQGNIIPSLAEKWEFVNNSNLLITLRDGVQFHNGDILTAEDVVFSINRMKSTPGLIQDMAREILDAEEISSNQVLITTTPNPSYILHLLSHNHAAIMNKQVTEALGEDIAIHVMGTGAFKIKEHKLGDYVILERFEDYFDGTPPTQFIKVRNIPDEFARQLGLETGELDIAYTGKLRDADFQTNANLQNYEPIKFESSRLEFLGMNYKNPIFTNQILREAIFAAVDRTNIVAIALEGNGIPSAKITAPRAYPLGDVPDMVHKPIDTNAVKNIVKEPLKFGIMADYKQAAEIIQANLKEIGIDTRIQMYEKAAFLHELETGGFDLFIDSKISVTQHPDEYFRHVFHSDSPPSVGNSTGYSNPHLDGLLDAALVDFENSKPYYEEIIKILSEGYAIVPLYVQIYIYTQSKDIEGFYLDPIFSIRFENTKKLK